MTLRHLQRDDGSWDELEEQWRAACRSFREEFADYARDALPVLQSLITGITACGSCAGGFHLSR